MKASSSQIDTSSDVTTTMKSNGNDDDAQQFQQIIRDRQYEREDVQKKAFTKWINNQLAKTSSTTVVTDLFKDLRDGVVLLQLLEVLTGNEYKRENGKMRVHHIENINKVLGILNEHGIKLLNISPNDIVDGYPKLTLALIWSIIQYWQGKDVMESVVPESQQTNIEKFLLAWCQEVTKGYKGVNIIDFTRSWQDGLAFNALIHKFRPDLFNYDELLQNASARNLEHAFNIAKNVFKIDRYLDVEDVFPGCPDPKSILMYVMCLFQQLPASNIVIEDNDRTEPSTTMTTNDNAADVKSLTESESAILQTYQTNMERILQWILQLENELDKNDKDASNDLIVIKEQFQNHEEFMISLTRDQNQIGDVLQEGNLLLTSKKVRLQPQEENEIKEQMKSLNRRWELLRSKSLDRQTILHKTLMKLQMDQIDAFDTWLSNTEQRISTKLQSIDPNPSAIDLQHQQLSLLQDELVSQQEVTESLQNMIIVIDDSSINDDDPESKYSSTEIEGKLLNLSERWANICNFVHNRWVQLQELKVELEHIEINRKKVDHWLTSTQDEMNNMKSDTNISNTDIIIQQVRTIQRIETEMHDIRQSILSLDNSLKILSTLYDSTTSKELNALNEEINNFEKRWAQLIDDLEQCSARLKKANTSPEKSSQINVKSNSSIAHKTITTNAEQTTSAETITATNQNSDDPSNKTTKHDNENTMRTDFNKSVASYIEWIENIERILDETSTINISKSDERLMIEEIKSKYESYNKPFICLIQTGYVIIKQLKDADEDSSELESLIQTLEQRWQELPKKILKFEQNIEQSKFNEEIQALANVCHEYQSWLDSVPLSNTNTELQTKLTSFQAYKERLAHIKTMADRFDINTNQRANDLIRSWDETHSRLHERTIPIEHMQPQASSTTTSAGATTFRQTEFTTIPVSPSRSEIHEQSSSTTTNLGQSVGENGSLFTLTNIYTFGGNDPNYQNPTSDLSSDNYRVKSHVEVFDQPLTQRDSEYERRYHESHSSSVTRKVHTSSSDTYDYAPNGNYESSYSQRHYETTSPTSTRYIHEQRSQCPVYLSSLPSMFTDIRCKLRAWLEYVERSLLNDKIRITENHGINVKKKVYKDLLTQTFEQEHNLEALNTIASEYFSKLNIDDSQYLRDELTNYRDRLNDIKMFLSERLTRCTELDGELNTFQTKVEETKTWIRNAQTRIASSESSSYTFESEIFQQEIRERQSIINRLNTDIIDLMRKSDENLARRLRDEIGHLNTSWSHFISTAKIHSQNIQDNLKRSKLLQEEIREIDEWISSREREIVQEDGSIFYPEQLRERFEQYQRIQSDVTYKEHIVKSLTDQVRLDLTQSASIEMVPHLDALQSNLVTLKRRVDNKILLYSELYKLYDELKELLYEENVWLDTLKNKIFATTSSVHIDGASAELESLERFLKAHPQINYEKILELADRLQATKVSLATINNQINQFRMRWDLLHNDAVKKIQDLNSQIIEHQQSGHQITAMFEWMSHTDTILNARIKGDICANDVPSEAEKLAMEFNQYDGFLRDVGDRIHALRTIGNHETAERLDQQYALLNAQFNQLKTKFRQFQRPSDFGPKLAKVRQILYEVEPSVSSLEIRSDDPDVIHNQFETCSRLYKTLLDIKSDVEYVIRVGRNIVERGKLDETNDLTRQIDQLKVSYNTIGGKVTLLYRQLESVERHLRKFRKEYSQVHEWFVKADHEIRKIENKPVSKNTKEEVDWIRATRNDIRKVDANFEVLRSLEVAIQKDAERRLLSLDEKIIELRRQVDQLNRRLKDRADIVEGHVRKLEDDYQRFTHIYKEIIIRLEKLDSLLSDAERVLDLTRISQIQEELRSVRTQLDDILNLGQDLVSKSETYSRLVGPDIENITRNFEELQRRIRTIQEIQDKRMREQQVAKTATTTTTTTTTTNNNTNQPDNQRDEIRREYYSEKRYNRTERESRHRSPSESSDISTTHGVVDEEFKKKYLRCLAYMKLIERLYDKQHETDEDVDVKNRRKSRRERTVNERTEYEEIERIIRETEERAYFVEKTDPEQARRIREKIRRLKECLETLRSRTDQYQANDEVFRYSERYEENVRRSERTVPRERELDSDFIYDMDDTRSVISEPAPQFNAKFRKTVHSLERYRADDHQARCVPVCEEYQLQPLLRVRSLKAIDHRTLSAPSSPILQPRYRSYERSNIQYTKQSKNQQGVQDSFQTSISKSASMPNGGFPMQQSLLPHPPPPNFCPQQPMVYRERVIDRHVAEKNISRGESRRQQHQESSAMVQQQQQQQQQQVRSGSASGQTQRLNRSIPVQYESSKGFRSTTNHSQEQNPPLFHHEQFGGGAVNYRQHNVDQQTYSPQNVGRHPQRIPS